MTRSSLSASLAISLLFGLLAHAQQAPQSTSPIARHYIDGEKLAYLMTADNNGWTYEVQGSAVVKKNAEGHFVEEFAWSNFKSSAPMSLSPQSLAFRQTLSLDPAMNPSVPDLSRVQPFLIGPITDLLTFYSDLWLATKQDGLRHPGDHAYVPFGGPASWADGAHVILGEDSIDFDLSLKSVEMANHVATLVAKHVPPPQPKVKLPAAWMQTPVADTPNNFVNVQNNENGKFSAQVGKETFDVEIRIDLPDGKILSATLDNLVQVHERECSDAALTACGEPSSHAIHRRIEIHLIP